jgi:ParB-like chromosome segregation protein Spo0J
MIRKHIPIDSLLIREDNPRLLKKAKFKKLKKSIESFPEMMIVRPIVINEKHEILAGTMRYLAVQELGWEEVFVIQVNWSEEEQKEFMIKDNTHAGDWDTDKLFNLFDVPDLMDWSVPVVHEVMLDSLPYSDITFRFKDKDADFVISQLKEHGKTLEEGLLNYLKNGKG